MEKVMRILSEFISEDGERTSTVLYVNETSFCIEMYEHKDIIERRFIDNHTLQYCEDCAENWVNGII
jgi:hypothetical protein